MHFFDSAVEEGGTAAPRAALRGWLALIVVLSGVPLALCTQPGAGPGQATPDHEPTEFLEPPTPGVHVALHLDDPLVPDRTVVWTAAFQAAWDQLADTLGMPQGLSLGAPADPQAVRALNAGRLAPGTVDPNDLTVVVGPATEATWDAIDRVSERPRPAGAPTPDKQDLVAFARLRASVRYEVPFLSAEEPVLFGPREVPVKAWGLGRYASGADAERMREQVRVYLPADAPREDPSRAAVIVLTGGSGKRVVISRRPPHRTLRETWQDISAVIATANAQAPEFTTQLTIPRVAIVAGRTFKEIAPAPFTAITGGLALARQDVRLVVDERGAEVDAEAVAMAVGSLPLVIDITGPFLVALLAAESGAPYVVAWVGSERGLTPWGTAVGRPATRSQVRPLVGTWAVDLEQSLTATVVAMRRVLGPEAAGRSRLTRSSLSSWFRDWTLDLRIDLDGRTQATLDGSPKGPQSGNARLRHRGEHILLDFPQRYGSGSETYVVSREGDHLKLHFRRRSKILILRRR